MDGKSWHQEPAKPNNPSQQRPQPTMPVPPAAMPVQARPSQAPYVDSAAPTVQIPTIPPARSAWGMGTSPSPTFPAPVGSPMPPPSRPPAKQRGWYHRREIRAVAAVITAASVGSMVTAWALGSGGSESASAVGPQSDQAPFYMAVSDLSTQPIAHYTGRTRADHLHGEIRTQPPRHRDRGRRRRIRALLQPAGRHPLHVVDLPRDAGRRRTEPPGSADDAGHPGAGSRRLGVHRRSSATGTRPRCGC